MNCAGIGKTTLAHEICLRWARDGFLAEDFDAVILIPLRSVQQRSLEKVIMEHIGEENYQQMKKSAGSRCLIILEGFDEMAADRRQNDPFLLSLIEECTVLEEATLIITSRTQACEEIDGYRKVEVVGFGKDEIRQFIENSFSKEPQCVEELLGQLDEYPQLYSLCYVPMHLLMVVDIFSYNEKKLPSTLTKLYQLLIVMILQRQVMKNNITNKPGTAVIAATADSIEEMCVMLRGIPKETVGIVMSLSKLAYRSFFDWYCDREGVYEPKILFTISDLIQCDIEVTSEFDGFGLLKGTVIHGLLQDDVLFNFTHFSIQEFLCSVYTCLLPEQEKMQCVDKLVHYNRLWEFCSDLAPSMFTNCMLHNKIANYNL